MPHPLAITLLPLTDLSVNQLLVLALIFDTPVKQRTLGSLSTAANLWPVTMTRAADKLEQRGFARRRPGPKSDKRIVLLEITAKGRRLLEAISPSFDATPPDLPTSQAHVEPRPLRKKSAKHPTNRVPFRL